MAIKYPAVAFTVVPIPLAVEKAILRLDNVADWAGNVPIRVRINMLMFWLARPRVVSILERLGNPPPP
jgi:hypothetical protein